MTDYRALDLADATVGQHVTVWALEDGAQTWGQGGQITALTPELVLTVPGVAEHRFPLEKFTAGEMRIEIEVPTDPTECVEYGPDCSGEVEYYDPTGRRRGVQRCAHHREQRAASYRNSIEQYAYVSSPPSWHDPSYAGESWEEH